MRSDNNNARKVLLDEPHSAVVSADAVSSHSEDLQVLNSEEISRRRLVMFSEKRVNKCTRRMAPDLYKMYTVHVDTCKGVCGCV